MQPKKIPTLIGLLFVVFTIVLFGYGVDRIGPLFTKASTSVNPIDVMVSNITDTGFTISWTTKSPATGAITLASDLSNHEVVYDERDVTLIISGNRQSLGIYTTHSVTYRNANPMTVYSAKIISNGTQFQDINGPYTIHTGPQLDGKGTSIEPAFGKITTELGDPAENALLYLTLDNGQMLSTLVKSSGSWVIPLNLVREKTLTSYISPTERIDETIIFRSNTQEGQAYADTLNDNPMPEMILGKSYDFRKVQAAKLQDQQLAQTSPSVLGTSTTTPLGVIAITKPKDNQALATDLPIFQGTGIPNKNVSLIIGITNPRVGQTTVGIDGIWRYTPPSPLSIGKQSITMTTLDAQNKPVALTHMFEILKSGTQVLGDATPSATLEPTLSILASPTSQPVDASTLAGEPVPNTGFPLPLLILLTIGILCITGGSLLIVKI